MPNSWRLHQVLPNQQHPVTVDAFRLALFADANADADGKLRNMLVFASLELGRSWSPVSAS